MKMKKNKFSTNLISDGKHDTNKRWNVPLEEALELADGKHHSNKRWNVPLEEALELAGDGLYTNYLTLIAGLSVFCGTNMVMGLSIVLPAAGCELQLNSVQKGTLTGVSLAGAVFSSHLFGILADVYGRKKVVAIANLLSAMMAALASFAPDHLTLTAVWFLNGFMLAGVFTPTMVYISEFCPSRSRAKGLLMSSAFGSLGAAFLPCLAWVIVPLDIRIPLIGGLVFTSWRLFILLLSLPSLLTFFFFYSLPESPKFLLIQGKSTETLNVLKTLFAINNKKSKEDFPALSVCLDFEDKMELKTEGDSGGFGMFLNTMWSQTVTLFTPPLVVYTIASCIVQFGLLASFNTVTLWIPEQISSMMQYVGSRTTDNVTLCEVMSHSDAPQPTAQDDCSINYNAFLFSIVIGLIQFAMFFVANIVTNVIGRKSVIILFITIPAIISTVMVYLEDMYLIFACLGLISTVLGSCMPVTVSILVDFFPTSLRSTATSVCLMFGRIGSAGGSQLMGALFQSYCREAYFGISAILIAVAVLFAVVPLKKKVAEDENKV